MILIGEVMTDEDKKGLETLFGDIGETLTEEPGETNFVEFCLNTGDSLPLAQRPCMTEVGLRQAVEEEIHWLVRKGYIRKSKSEWVLLLSQ